MKKTIDLNVCDYCYPNNKKIHEVIAVDQCSVCDGYYCEKCYLVDTYYTTYHCEGSFKPLPTCEHCWRKCLNSDKELPRIGTYSGTGSSFAISVGNFTRYFTEKARTKAAKELAKELKKLI